MLISKNTPKEVMLKEYGSKCELCGHCCHFSSGIVLNEELSRLAKAFLIDEAKFKAKYLEEFTKFNTTLHRFKQVRKGNAPHGRCIFLNIEEEKCSIQGHKPLHCRVSTCSNMGSEVQRWFDTNFFLNLKDPVSVREYAIYVEFNEPLIGAELKRLVPEQELKKIMEGGYHDTKNLH
jgi:Fe-S-cluster containining protein